MTDKKDGPAAGPDRGQSGNQSGNTTGNTAESAAKRPFATIDLKATEVKITAGSGPSSTGSGSTGAGSAGPNTTSPTTTSPTTTSKAGSASTPAGASAQTAAAEKVVAAAKALNQGNEAAASSVPLSGARPQVKSGQPGDSRRGETADTAKAGDAPAGPAAAKATPQPRNQGGVLSHMAAGIAGGLLAMLGLPFVAPLLGLDGERPAPAMVSGLTPAHEARLNVLEKQVRERLAAPAAGDAAKPPADTARLDDLTRQIGVLNEAQGKLVVENAALREEMAKQASLKDAGDRLARMEEQLNGMVAAATADPLKAGRLPQLASLTAQIADLKTALDTRLAAHRKDMTQEIDTRVASAAEAAEDAKAGAKRLDGEVAAVRSEATRLGQRVEQLKTGSDKLEQSLKSVQDEQTAFKTAVDDFKVNVADQLKSTARPNDVAMALAPVAAKVTSLETSVQSVIRAEEDRKSNAERIVLSLELGNLKRAMDRGQKFVTELDEVKKNAGGRLNLAVLEKFQNQGVPSIVDLSRSFRPLANAILDAEAEPANGALVDRLLTGARTVVRVRKTSHSPDDASSEAMVARMESALKEQRLADVIGEARKLPPKALVPAKDWLAQVEARYAVEAELASIDLALKNSLGAGPGAGAAQKGGK